ncbi:MAG: SusC/RagA family TonB-linked outer membrane protein, partial [Gemmatimonadota bacterium]|nr:SusC/RagA family TonB-linked outer membrane protein [Gemmatimonadota bacterium]
MVARADLRLPPNRSEEIQMSKFSRLLATLVAVALIPAGALAQGTGTVSGRVTGEGGNVPLAGVQVRVQGTERRAVTGQNGGYSISGVPAGRQTIDASVIGREAGSVVVAVLPGQTATANFSLAATALELEGIVVNAITGRQERKREVGANVATIEVADINKGPITKFADVLTGRTAGVNLQGVAGTTGTSQRIRIRGANSLSLSNEPLVYIDGILFSNSKGGLGVGGQDFSRLNDLNSEDIASIEVLKGPAASALYGTAAANGVLLITTKKGRSGGAVWRAYAEAGTLEDVNDYPEQFLAFQVNDPSQPFLTSLGRLNTGTSLQQSRRTGPFVACPNLDFAAGLCRRDEVVRFNFLEDSRTSPFSTGERFKGGFNVSGGSDALTYYVSADTEDEQGVISFNTLDKQNFRANFTARISDKLNLGISSGYIDSKVVLNQNDNNIFSPLINGLLATPFFIPGQDTLRSPGSRPGLGFGYSIQDISNIVTTQEVDRFIGGLNGTYVPLPWLSANANVGLDFFTRYDFETIQPGRLPIGSPFTEGFRAAVRSNSYQYTGNGSTTAKFDLRDNLVSTSTLGASYNRQLFENTSCFGAGIVEGTRSCGASSSQFSVDEDFSEIITVGGFFQQALAINDRIFLAASVRGDDNSAFGQNFGFIYYPSASASWVVSEEPFFPQLNFLSNLRLRAAYGTSGLRPNFRDAVTLLSPVAVTVGGQELSAVTLNRTGNDELKPEKSTEFEFGFDSGLFDDRLSAEVTYFTKRSEDALISRRLPPSFGLTTSVFDNLGAIRNSGTELALNARVLEFPRALLNLRISATALDNEIVELGEGVEPIIFNRGNQRHQQGFPAGAFFQAPIIFNDADGNGILTRNEVRIDSTRFTQVRNAQGELETIPFEFFGPSLPTQTQSLSGDLTLFEFLNISTLFERRAGNKSINFTERFRCTAGAGRITRGGCSGASNPDATLEEQAAFIGARFFGTNAGYIEDTDFVKWREVAVRVGTPTFLARSLPALGGATLTLSGR